jgi:hypothetical protein
MSPSPKSSALITSKGKPKLRRLRTPFVLPRLKVLATTAAYAAEIAAWSIPVSHR